MDHACRSLPRPNGHWSRSRLRVAASLVLGTLGLANPRKFSWAFRCVAGVISFICIANVVLHLTEFRHGHPFGWRLITSDSDFLNAMMAFFVFGLPAAIYALGLPRLPFLTRGQIYIDVLTSPPQHRGDTLLNTITDGNGSRRVLIVRRRNGTFGFEEERWSSDPQEQCWIPLPQNPICLCDSEERALREARGRVSWLSI